MKTLHYISETKENDLRTTHVRTLCEALSEHVQALIVTDKTLKTLGRDDRFDIVHIHSCWDINSTRLIAGMKEKGMAVVLSPHGDLDAFTMLHEQQITKQGKRLLYQQKAVEIADALIAMTKREKESLQQLGWNNNIDVVKASILDSTMSHRQMAEETLAVYRKVIDTRYRLLMTDQEKQAICCLLRTGIARDDYQQTLTKEEHTLVTSLNDTQWQRIMLYADDEGIRDIIDLSTYKNDIEAPDINAAAIARYPKKHKKDTQPLKRLLPKGKATTLLHDSSATLQQLVAMLIDAKKHIQKNTLTMKQLSELYIAFRYGDYDEDEFAETSRKLSIYTFTSRMLSVLHSLLMLGEGFMPMPPKSDSTTQNIMTKIL